MKLIITGGAGFIGSAVIRVAVMQGHQILNIDKLTYAANLTNLTEIEHRENYQLQQADICDTQLMTSLMAEFKPDAIMHLAAESHVDRSIDGPSTFIETNIVGTFSLLEAARAYVESGCTAPNFKFHHVSTDEVFGSLGTEGAFTEDSPYRPNSPYAASKASSDMLARAWHKTYGLPVIVSNCSNNYGPFQFPEKLIPVVIERARAGQPIEIYGDGSNIRDWLHVTDHADALLLIAARGETGETYNVGGREERTNLELVKMICAIMDDRFPDAPFGPHESLISFVTDRPGHDARYAVDCQKIERELCWTPKTSLEAGLRSTVDWYLDNQDWIENIKTGGYRLERVGLNAQERVSQ